MFAKISSKKKGGFHLAFPDVCMTPTPMGPVPIPYPNVVISSKLLKKSSFKFKKLKTDFAKKNGGDEKIGVLISRISSLFALHSATVLITGKQASKPQLPNKAAKVFQRAKKQQKTFERKVKKECDELLRLCKNDKDKLKVAKSIVSLAGLAARGHPI